MKRSILSSLVAWKDHPGRKPLILKGVRQCGKTYILREFGQYYFQDIAYFNFEERPALCRLFEQDLDVKRILFELGLEQNRTIHPETTLIIFDEIQECPKALTCLKYFCENAPQYAVACAGSLLGIAIHTDHSFPVGKVDFLTLYPMSFYEFLTANGQETVADYLQHMGKNDSLSELISQKLSSFLKQYYLVGGMPEAVQAWKDTNDITFVETIQQRILLSYQFDFVKHASPDLFPKLSAIWASIPQQLSKSNHKFIFSHVKKGWRAKDLEDALQWLIDAGLIYKVCRIEKPFWPLSAYADASAFKLYLADVGLLRKLAQVPPQMILHLSENYVEFRGAMTENYVLNELVKVSDTTPYYWTSGNQAEVDFVFPADDEIVPIEVKSEKSTRARSLSEYRNKYCPNFAVLTSMKPDTGGDHLLNIPLYQISSLKSRINSIRNASSQSRTSDP